MKMKCMNYILILSLESQHDLQGKSSEVEEVCDGNVHRRHHGTAQGKRGKISLCHFVLF